MAASDPQDNIRRTVREHDPDRYIATLFAPADARPALMALYAFNIDVARIPEAVSEPMLGEIRLQWWRDALETLEKGGVTGNPAADTLGHVLRDYALPKGLLLGAIDARSFDLSGGMMPDRQAMKAYLQKTSGNLFAAAARVLGSIASPDNADRLAGEAGYVWGLTGKLASLPLHLAHGRFYLPLSDFRDQGADPQALLRGEADERARVTLAGLRNELRESWSWVRGEINRLPPRQRMAFLPLSLVPAWLDALESRSEAPLEAVAEINPLSRIARLTWAAARGKI